MAFRDYEKAFDSVENATVMKALRKQAVVEIYGYAPIRKILSL